MSTALHFRNARLFDGYRFRAATELTVACDGRILELGDDLETPPEATVLDLGGRTLMPGLVDCHVHFREPGLEWKEGYAFGSAGALHGGVTTICEIQNNPPLMATPDLLREKLESLRGVSRVDYAPYGSLVEASLEHLPTLRGMCPAVKVFLGGSTGSGGIGSEENMRRWFQAAADAGLKVVAHCEDDAVMDRAAAALADDPELCERHDLQRSVEAEEKSIRDAIRVAAECGLALHVFHLSSAAGAERILEAVEIGQPVTCSTGPQYLLVTAEEAHAAVQNRFKVNPSIKYAEDREALGGHVASGRIPVIGTDHAPHPLEHKDRPYRKAPSGFPSIDLLLPLVVTAAARNGDALEAFLHAVTAGPAEEFGLSSKGRLQVGADADLVVVDLDREQRVDEALMLSRSGWSPYHGYPLKGFAQQVYLHGELAFADGQVVGEPRGRPLFLDS